MKTLPALAGVVVLEKMATHELAQRLRNVGSCEATQRKVNELPVHDPAGGDVADGI